MFAFTLHSFLATGRLPKFVEKVASVSKASKDIRQPGLKNNM